MSVKILHGDCLALLSAMPAESVHTCVTSPPYFGLRDYGHAGQIGLESTPEEFIAKLVAVFREVRRVLRDDGTLWVNMGDSYNSVGHKKSGSGYGSTGLAGGKAQEHHPLRRENNCPGLKHKDLIGIPWMLAFALRADGWYLRQDIIWSKPNPMPESVKDRCTKAHEYLFLLAKGQWKSRIVNFSDLSGERRHFGEHIVLQEPLVGEASTQFCVRYATAVLQHAQRKHGFSLPPFYAQEWKQGSKGEDSVFVRCLPVEHRPAIWAARLLCADVSPKEFMSEVNRLPVALPDGDEFLVSGRDTLGSDTPHIHSDGDGAVTINDAGKVGKIEFIHERIVVSTPATCKYYCDMDAIKEPSTGRAAGNVNPQKGEIAYAAGDERLRTRAGLTAFAERSRRDSFKRDESKRAEVIPGQSVGTHRPDRDESDYSLDARNKRSVWEVATQPFAEAHFATFPPALIEPCIKAGCPEGGTVLDPFGGAGTTGLVADRLQRSAILCELNADYIAIAKRRIEGDAPLFTELEAA